MTRITKPALIAGSLAALLLSTGLANAAPARGHDGRNAYTQTDKREARGTRHDAGKDHYASRRSVDRRDSEDRKDVHRDGRDRHDGFDHRFERGRDGRLVYHADYDHARYRDAWHRPPVRIESVRYAPHPGMRWQAGDWRWQNGEWAWIVGTWLITAEAASH